MPKLRSTRLKEKRQSVFLKDRTTSTPRLTRNTLSELDLSYDNGTYSLKESDTQSKNNKSISDEENSVDIGETTINSDISDIIKDNVDLTNPLDITASTVVNFSEHTKDNQAISQHNSTNIETDHVYAKNDANKSTNLGTSAMWNYSALEQEAVADSNNNNNEDCNVNDEDLLFHPSDSMKYAIETNSADFWYDIHDSSTSYFYEWSIPDYNAKGSCTKIFTKNFSLTERNWNLSVFSDKIVIENCNDHPNSILCGRIEVVGPTKYWSTSFSHNFAQVKHLTLEYTTNDENNVLSSEGILLDSMTMHCTFKDVKLHSTHGSIDKTHPCKKECPGKVLISQFEIPRDYDVEFIVGNAKFTAHKVILKFRCLKFWNDISDNVTVNGDGINVVKINYVSPRDFKEFLRFIYTNEIESDCNAECLVQLAMNYSLTTLKEKCVDILINSLNPENALQLYTFAQKLNAENLMDKSMEIILKNLDLISFEDFHNYVSPYIKNSKKQVSVERNKTSSMYGKNIRKMLRWSFNNLDKITLRNFKMEFSNIEVADMVFNFHFVQNDSKNICLTVIPKEVKDAKFRSIEITIVDDVNKIIYLKQQKYKKNEQTPADIRFDEILKYDDTKEKRTFTLYFHVLLWQKTDIMDLSVNKSITEDIGNSLHEKDHTLCKDLKKLFMEMPDYDVVFRTESKELRAHKCIIGPYSRILNDTFIDHTSKNKQGTLMIITIEIPYKIIQEMLRFFYTGEVHNINEHARELLNICKLFDLKSSLNEMCESVLSSMINMNNVFEMLNFAKMCESNVLKIKCWDYLKENKNGLSRLVSNLDLSNLSCLEYETLKQIYKLQMESRVNGKMESRIGI